MDSYYVIEVPKADTNCLICELFEVSVVSQATLCRSEVI